LSYDFSSRHSVTDVRTVVKVEALSDRLDMSRDRSVERGLTHRCPVDGAPVAHSGLLEWTSRILEWAHVDRAVVFGVFARFWAMLSGPVTILLIASFFSPQTQGYYYTFASLLALQVFVELGLSQVIIQFASHEWSRLHLDEGGRIQGDLQAISRLVSIGRISASWYAVGAGILAVGLGLAGCVFFLKSDDGSVRWAGPWLSLCLLTALRLLSLPFFSLLEGCNQVSEVYRYRFTEGIIRSVFLWLPILLGLGLWTPSVSTGATVVWSVLFVVRRYRYFFRPFLSPPQYARIAWGRDLWPLQWRIAISWLCGYFVFNLFTPILFHYHGPVVAGQMGMTWSLAALLSSVTACFVMPKAPRFGMLIAQHRYVELDQFFWQITKVAALVTGLSTFCLWLLTCLLSIFAPGFADRMLPPLPAGLFFLASALISLSYPMSAYMRAHKKEPLLWLSVISAILVATSNLVFGRYYGATGMAIGYVLTNILVLPFVVLIWHRFREIYRKDHPADPALAGLSP
jgi:O-antigen/teichoic acid export membrane protein